MADVSRGQLVLVTGIALATVLVVLTVVLNGAVYAENLATGEGADDRQAAEYSADAAATVADLLAYTNRNDDTSYVALRTAFAGRVGNWSEATAAHAAVEGGDRHVTLRAATNGTRVAQPNASRTFASANGTQNWTVVADATGVRAFTATVARDALVAPNETHNATALTDAGAFAAALNGAERHRMFLYRNGTDVVVRVENASGLAAPCRAAPDANGTVHVDVTNASVAGRDCPALSLFGALGDPFDVRFERSGNATGTFSMVVDRPVGDVDDEDLAAPGAGTPYAAPALYDAQVAVAYATPTLAYETTLRVAPGEPDA